MCTRIHLRLTAPFPNDATEATESSESNWATALRLRAQASAYNDTTASTGSNRLEWNGQSGSVTNGADAHGSGRSRPSSLAWNHRSSVHARCLTIPAIVRFVDGNARAVACC